MSPSKPMQPTYAIFVLATTLGSLALRPAPADAQADQRALAEQLLGEDARQTWSALVAVERLGPDSTGPELREALVAALHREANLHAERYWHDARGEPWVQYERGAEYLAHLTRAVIALRDPRAIDALAAAVGTGSTATPWALADFGDGAAPAVLDIVTSPGSAEHQVNGALMTLRVMAEEREIRPLSAATMERIRCVALRYVTGPQYFTTLWRAIDLAGVLDDPYLRGVLQDIASDPEEVIARGETDPDLIEKTQKRAADRLAGIPPLPRRR